MKKMKYVKPSMSIRGVDLDNVICAGSVDTANWGKITWPNEGYEIIDGKYGVDVDDDNGEIDSRSKKHSWSAWDD